VSDPRRGIPSVDRLLASDAFAPLLARAPRTLVRDALQAVQREVREALGAASVATGRAQEVPVPGAPGPEEYEPEAHGVGAAGEGNAGTGAPVAEVPAPGAAPRTAWGGGGAVPRDPAWFAARVAERLDRLERPSLRPVINATGVVLHTNLGRAPLPDAALAAIARVARSYSNLEYDVAAGVRGSRYDHCAALLQELTGAEAALVVNNNAAAVVLALNTIAAGREAVVSRGELVEIGGSFRIPEIMERSGARLHEVGATNRTHRGDYERALSDATGAVLKVHRSNFRIVGFTADVSLADVAEIAHARGVPVLCDLGSGLLFDLTELGLPPEPTATAALRAGADVVTMSGDKLLGGPQAGIVLGRREWIDRMRKNPLCRAFRVDKLTLAALEATLALYRDPGRARREIPVLRMLGWTVAELGDRARAFAERLRTQGVEAELRAGGSAVGGGAYPGVELPTVLVVPVAPRGGATALERRLRDGDPAVIARVVDGAVALDLRTVLPDEEEALLRRIVDACA
jgi:L-seryl-tRNA(Ser) seleniumtransferase